MTRTSVVEPQAPATTAYPSPTVRSSLLQPVPAPVAAPTIGTAARSVVVGPAPHSAGPTTAVLVRRATTEDVELVADLVASMRPASVTTRFFSPRPVLDQWLLDHATGNDGSIVVIALIDGRCVGHASLHRDSNDPATAELAIMVADEHHRRGIARTMLCTLLSEGARAGVAQLTAFIRPENWAARSLLRQLGARSRFADGELEAEVPICIARHALRTNLAQAC